MIFQHIRNVLQRTRSRSVYLNGQPHQQFKIDCGITSNAHTKQQFGEKKKTKIQRARKREREANSHAHTWARNQSRAGVLNITRWWQNIHYVSIIVCVYFSCWSACEWWRWANEWTNEQTNETVSEWFHYYACASLCPLFFDWIQLIEKSVNKTIASIQWRTRDRERESLLCIVWVFV